MTRRIATRVAAVASAAVAAAVLPAGCGGSSSDPSPQIKHAVATYFSALAHHDAAGICRVQTTGYWNATRVEADTRLAATGRQSLPTDCAAGFARLFALNGTNPPSSDVTVTDVVAHGDAATGTLVSGSQRQAMRFVRAGGGQWQISCCTGAQVTERPQSTITIPSGGMLPTLKVGQVVSTDNTTLRSRAPLLGEIVLFHPPSTADQFNHQCPDPGEGSGHKQPCGAVAAHSSGELFVKRVVGLPGDRIAIDGGRVERNGRLAREPFISPCHDQFACNFREPITVPAESYYLVGDNRGASDDSRFWGPVPRGWIVGLIKLPH